MKTPIIDLLDLQMIFFMGQEKAQALALEFNSHRKYILLPNYRLN